MNLSKQTHLFTRFRTWSWLLVGVWTGCVAGSLWWNLHQGADHSLQMARLTAQVTFENDLLYRRWAAQRGGVYVRVSADTPPNPHLRVPERDVITTSGLSLTLVNPAYMARQVNALAGATEGSRGHLTSLKPIRPENAPDPWEAAALRSFEQGVGEVSQLAQMTGGEHLRLMRPFVTERSCLACHADQGYREGDIRGGISVSVPMAPLRAIEKPTTDRLVWAHAGLWMVGLVGIGFSRRGLGREILARERASTDLQREVTERRLAEDQLREANDRYELVLAGAEAGLWDWDVPRRKVIFSPRWKAMRGLADEEVSDAEEEWSQGIHPEDAPRVMAAVQAHFAGRTPFFAEEYRVRRKDGSWMWVADRGLARRDAQGRVLRMAGSETDITERRQHEQELHALNERLQGLMEATPVGISFSEDSTCQHITGNSAVRAQFELGPAENLSASAPDATAPGRQIRYFHRGRLLADAELPMQRAIAENRMIPPMELEVVLPSGRRWFTEASGAPVRDAQGRVIGGITVTVDITERVRAENARRETEERYHSLFNAMTEGFALHQIVTDEQGRPCDYVFLDLNPAFERLTGFQRAHLLGRRVREVMPAIEDSWIEQYGRVALTGEPAHLESFSAVLNRWFEAFAYRTAPGQFAVVFADVTARKQAEERLRQSTAELQAANASLLDSRRAALNLMDDALAARRRAEQVSTELRQEVAERKRAEEALQRTSQRYVLLSEVAGALLAAPNPQAVVEELCRKVMRHLECDVFFNFLTSEAEGRLRLNACAGIPADEARKIEWLDYGVAVCGSVARDRKRIIAEDIANTPDRRTELVKSYGVQAYCCHPMIAGGRLLGTLGFGTRQRGRFTAEEVDLMQAVTDQVAVAMERIRAERALQESESFHRQTLESIPGMVFTTRPDGYCDYQNQQWVDFTGVPMSEHVGDGWNKLLHPEDQPRAFAAWRDAVEDRAPYAIEYRVRRRDGEYEWFKVRGRPIRDETGQIVRWFGTALNIEDLKRAEEHLKASLREKEVLLQEIHHRVKNNLQVVSSLINLQSDSLDDPGLRASLNDVRDRVRTMALVHEKLYQSGDLARLNFADYAVGLLHYLWRAHGAAAASVRLNLATEPVTLPVETAIPCGLILNELAGNALKHAFRGRSEAEVTVGLAREAATNRVCLRVSDNGKGLPAGLDWQQTTSLGLRLVQMLTRQIGGSLEVGAGPGAEFRVAFAVSEGK